MHNFIYKDILSKKMEENTENTRAKWYAWSVLIFFLLFLKLINDFKKCNFV